MIAHGVRIIIIPLISNIENQQVAIKLQTCYTILKSLTQIFEEIFTEKLGINKIYWLMFKQSTIAQKLQSTFI